MSHIPSRTARMSRGLDFRFIAVVLFLLLPTGCFPWFAAPVDQPQARAIVERLRSQNEQLQQAKGLSRLRLASAGETLSGKVAWATRIPDQLRVEWLGALGQPLVSLAGDGRFVSIQSHPDREFHQVAQSPGILKKYLRIPIGIEELITLLAGRPLIPQFDAVHEGQVKGTEREYLLKNKWHTLVAGLYTDLNGALIKERCYRPDGTLRFTIEWSQWMTRDTYTLPEKIDIIMESGQRMTLIQDRLWTDAQLPDGIFVLSNPREEAP